MEKSPAPTDAPGRRSRQPTRAGQTPSGSTPKGWFFLVVFFPAMLFWLVKGVLSLIGYPNVMDAIEPVVLAVVIVAYASNFGFHLELKNIATSILDFVLAGLYLVAWLIPEVLGESQLVYLFWLVPVEFVATSCAFGTACFFEARSAWTQIKILPGFLGG